MRSVLFCLFLSLVTVALTAAAQSSPVRRMQAPIGPIYIVHVTVIDTVTGRELPDRTVVVSGDHIANVIAGQKAVPRSDAKIVDGKGRYLIPGLWDMHVHAVFAERIDSMFPMFVANGVLGIRDMGTSMSLAEIGQLRKDIQSGARVGPRIVAAGPILDGRPKPLRPNFLAITTPEAGRAEVDTLKSGGADLVKIYSWLTKDTFLAIADEARKQNIPFGGHVPFSTSALEASDAGMHSMEHLWGIFLACSSREDELRAEMLRAGPNLGGLDRWRLEGYEAADSYDPAKCAGTFAHFLKNRTWQVPTLTSLRAHAQGFDAQVTTDPRLRYIPPSFQQRWSEEAKSLENLLPTIAKFYPQEFRILSDLHHAGIPVLAGTDEAWYQAYTYAGFSLHEELTLLVRAGFTPAEALQSATIDPARFLGREKELGSVEKGKLADLVLLSADPLQNISDTQKIDAVIVNGRLLDREELDSLLRDAENAVKGR